MFDAIEGLLTAAGSALVVNGNPTSVTGSFIKMFKNPRVHKIHTSCFDTPNFNAIRRDEFVNLRAELAWVPGERQSL